MLVVDCDVPWIPRKEAQGAGQGDPYRPDPLFASYPLRGFRADLALTGAIAPMLQGALARYTEAGVSLKRIESAARRLPRAPTTSEPKGERARSIRLPSITGSGACVNKVLDDPQILVNESPTCSRKW